MACNRVAGRDHAKMPESQAYRVRNADQFVRVATILYLRHRPSTRIRRCLCPAAGGHEPIRQTGHQISTHVHVAVHEPTVRHKEHKGEEHKEPVAPRYARDGEHESSRNKQLVIECCLFLELSRSPYRRPLAGDATGETARQPLSL